MRGEVEIRVQLEFRARGILLIVSACGSKSPSPQPSKSELRSSRPRKSGARERTAAAAARNIRTQSTFLHGSDAFVAAVEEFRMLAPSSLLRTGLALKLSQIKLATRSYLRDRTKIGRAHV